MQSGAALKPTFLKRAEAGYHASAQECDFKRAADASRKTINDWVAKQTRDKIKDLLPPGGVQADTRLVLTNAVYFKGLWANPFPVGQTKTAPFLLADGKKTPLPLMVTCKDVTATDSPDKPYQTAKIGYKGGEVSMLVVVPRDPAGLPAVEQQLRVPGRGTSDIRSPSLPRAPDPSDSES